MAISPDIEAKILRYHHVEKWRVGTISRQLGVHHSTIKRVIAESGAPKANLMSQSMLDPFVPFVLETFDKYPKLTARRLYDMVRERGYRGGVDHFRHLMTLYRPKPAAEAYLRLRTLPGEQGQVDWGHFGHIMIGQAKRPLMAFVMVLSFSRKIFLRFYLNARMENFLRGHEDAFQYFSGVPRVLLYDNLKSAVLERCGDAIRFNPTLLDFAGHYRYEPRPVALARGNEKGRVERAIRYIRDNFFAARNWHDNDYSVPHTFVRRTLIVTASLDKITVLAGAEVIAEHNRSYKKGVQIENEAHIQELVARKKQASQHRGQNRLMHAIPIAIDLLKLAAERGSNMGQITMRLLQLLDDYGVVEMTSAITEAVAKQTPQPNSVRFILEQRRETRNQLPLVKLDLPNDKRVRELMVRPHNLTDYDQLNTTIQEIEDVK